MIRVMPIIRSRSGCFTCRRRKKKCNEEKPLCSGCRRNKLDCRWPAESLSLSKAKESRDGTSSTSPISPPEPGGPLLDKSSPVVVSVSGVSGVPGQGQLHGLPPPAPRAIELPAELAGRAGSPKPQSGPSPVGFYYPSEADFALEAGIDAGADASNDSHGSPAVSAVPNSAASAPILHDDPSQLEYGSEASDQLSASQVRALCRQVGNSLRPSVASPMALLPSHGHDSYELLSYYLSRTANSMGNGSTDVNPFIAKLVPLAFSNPLVLQLILAQSAAHRQASTSLRAGNEVAQQYYTDSLRMFRSVVGEYVAGKDEDPLTLTVGSLILCLTEVWSPPERLPCPVLPNRC